MPGYLEELGNDASRTETFVALKAEIANWRWAGVPFYLRTGKRLAGRLSEIVAQFRPIPFSVFDAAAGPIEANRLVIRLQPDEGVKLWLNDQGPRPGRHAAAPCAAGHELRPRFRRAQPGQPTSAC